MENLSAAEIKLARALTNYRLIMVETAKKRDEFDASPEGKKRKALKAWFSSTRKRAVIDIVVTIPNADDIKMKEKEQELKQLDEIRRVMVDKFDRTRTIISNTQKNLRVLQSSKAKSGTSLKTKLLKVLRSLGLSNQAIMAAV